MSLLRAAEHLERPVPRTVNEPVGQVTQLVVLGKIVEAHGLRGAVRIHPFADDPCAWSVLPCWWIGEQEGGCSTWRRLRLLSCREQGAQWIAQLDGLTDRTAAEAVRGWLVGAPREALPAPGEGEFYWGDLLGLDVHNSQGNFLGRVLGLIETPANAVLRVGEEAAEGGEGGKTVGRERLLPFIASVVREVDLPGRRLCVDWESDW